MPKVRKRLILPSEKVRGFPDYVSNTDSRVIVADAETLIQESKTLLAFPEMGKTHIDHFKPPVSKWKSPVQVQPTERNKQNSV